MPIPKAAAAAGAIETWLFGELAREEEEEDTEVREEKGKKKKAPPPPRRPLLRTRCSASIAITSRRRRRQRYVRCCIVTVIAFLGERKERANNILPLMERSEGHLTHFALFCGFFTPL